MTNSQRVSLIAAFENAAAFINDINKSAAAMERQAKSAERTATAVTKSGSQIATTAKFSADALVSADKRVIDSLANVEKARVKALAAANALAKADQGPARNAQGRFVPAGDPSATSGAGSPQQLAAEAAARKLIADAANEQAKAFQQLNAAQNELKALGGQVATFGPASEAVAQMSASVKALNPELVAMAAAEQAAAGGAQNLEENTEKVEKSTNNLAKSLVNVAKAAIVAFVSYKALGILKSIIQDTVDLGVETFKLQQEIGGTAEDVSALIFTFKQFGIEPTRLATTMGIFSRNLALVAENAAGLNTRGQQSTRVLAALGITVLQTNGQLVPTLDILKQLSDRFAEMSDENLKAGIASQLFGQNASDILPILNLGAAGIEAYMARAKELGVVLTDEGAKASFAFAQSQKELAAALTGVKVAIGQELLPIIADLTKKLTDFLTKNREAIGNFARGAAGALSQFAQNAATGLSQLNKLLSFIPENQGAIVLAIGAIGAAIAVAFGPAGVAFVALATFIAMLDRVQNFAVTGSAAKPESRSDQLRREQADLQERLEQNRRRDIQNPTPGGLGGSNITTPISELIRSLMDEIGATSGELENRIEVERRLAEITAELAAIEKAAADQKAADEAAKKAAQAAKEYQDALDGVSEAEKQAIQHARELAAAFRDSSIAAGQIESVTAGMNLFGDVSQELAEQLISASSELQGLEISAPELAGGIQGFDAVEAAVARTDAANFDYAKTLATVASVAAQAEAGIKGAASALQQLISSIASSALSAAQTAASNLFSKPTRELANLNVRKAQVDLLDAKKANLNNGPEEQIKKLNKTSDAIDDQIREINKSNQAAKKAADEANKARRRQDRLDDIAFRQAMQAARRAARDQLDALRLQHLMEQHAFERLIDGIQRLIDANNKARSELQEAFLKSNEALQRQINELIGKGDAEGALALVREQRKQAKAYQSQDEALRKNTEKLVSQQHQLELENREKQRQREIQMALAQSMVDMRLAALDAADAARDVSEAFEEDVEAVEQSTEALELQKEALEDQVEKIKEREENENKLGESIAKQIDIREKETELLQARVDAADKTLLTTQEQREAAEELIKMIGFESAAYKASTELQNKSVIPGMDDARLKFQLLTDALRDGTDIDIKQKFLKNGIDFAGLKAQIFARALLADAVALQLHVLSLVTATNKIKQIAEDAKTPPSPAPAPQDNPSSQKPKTPTGVGGGQGTAAAEGGIYNKPTLLLVGETYQKELVLPLERPARARQLIDRIPVHLRAALTNPNQPQRHGPSSNIRLTMPPGLLSERGNSGQVVFSPNIRVTGETLETMEVTALRALRAAFRDARTTSQRGGGLITQGLGPSR